MRTHLFAAMAAVLLITGPAFAGEALAAEPKAPSAARKSPQGKTLLRLKVDPPSRVYVDGADKGKVNELQVEVKPGGHIVRFVHESGDEHENLVVCQAGKTTAYEWKFDYSPPAAADVQDIVIP